MQSLRFLYRILFLLYAEASPELGVLPVGAPEYDAGYSLDRLRELVQVPLVTEQSMRGTHFYESLGTLFRLVDQGHREDVDEATTGLSFHSLRADLFTPKATAHIDKVGLGNQALQQVLERLLLSKEQHGKRGRERGYISYAELGINQLGAVYESLMSYTGFFATEDLYEVARDGNPQKGSWVVPLDRASGIADKDFVLVEDDQGRREPRNLLSGAVRLSVVRPRTSAVGELLHPGGTDEVHRRPGAGGAYRRHHHRRGDPGLERLRACSGVGSVRH